MRLAKEPDEFVKLLQVLLLSAPSFLGMHPSSDFGCWLLIILSKSAIGNRSSFLFFIFLNHGTTAVTFIIYQFGWELCGCTI